jgi:hypothetical protein
VSVATYQEVFCRMVASAAYRDRVLAQPDVALAGLDLSDRERRRVLAIAAQPGMRVNTAIHRANRLTPLDQTLPFTCFLLGDALGPLVDRYWQEHTTENLQLPAECERFAKFLEDRLRAGEIASPYVAEVLAFERACTELRFRVADDQESPNVESDRREGLPPRVRVVRFRHDPVRLLDTLSELRAPPGDLAEGAFHLVIDCRTGDPEFRLLDADGVAALRERGLI